MCGSGGDKLRTEVFKLTARPKFARDFKAQGQADDAVNSVCRNIAEGFACETHGEFARFLTFSQRSLNEVRDAMRGAMQKRYITPDDHATIEHLAIRLRPALARFIAYLRRTPDQKNRRDSGRRPKRTCEAKPSARTHEAHPSARTREAKPSRRTRER